MYFISCFSCKFDHELNVYFRVQSRGLSNQCNGFLILDCPSENLTTGAILAVNTTIGSLSDIWGVSSEFCQINILSSLLCTTGDILAPYARYSNFPFH